MSSTPHETSINNTNLHISEPSLGLRPPVKPLVLNLSSHREAPINRKDACPPGLSINSRQPVKQLALLAIYPEASIDHKHHRRPRLSTSFRRPVHPAAFILSPHPDAPIDDKDRRRPPPENRNRKNFPVPLSIIPHRREAYTHKVLENLNQRRQEVIDTEIDDARLEADESWTAANLICEVQIQDIPTESRWEVERHGDGRDEASSDRGRGNVK
jgi:hypothetical protein